MGTLARSASSSVAGSSRITRQWSSCGVDDCRNARRHPRGSVLRSAQLIASLTRVVRDVGIAEELAQDAVAALESWPASGIPAKPAAWLMTTAKRRAFTSAVSQQARRLQARATRARARVARFRERARSEARRRRGRRPVPCRRRRRPNGRQRGRPTRSPWALLVPEPTIAQRIVRASERLPSKRPVRGAARRRLATRLPSVLEVIYLIFNEGYAATAAATDAVAPPCDDALRLGPSPCRPRTRRAGVYGLVGARWSSRRCAPERGEAPRRARAPARPRIAAMGCRHDPARARPALPRGPRRWAGLAPVCLCKARISACHARATSGSPSY